MENSKKNISEPLSAKRLASGELIPDKLDSNQRRQFLTQLCTVIGVGAVGSMLVSNSITSAFAYQRNNSGLVKAGRLFTLNQMAVLHDICDVVLPKTDTPSAADVDCHGFIDHQLMNVYTVKERLFAVSIIDRIEKGALTKHNQPFVQLTVQLKQYLLNQIESLDGFDEQEKNDFKQLKTLIVFGFFTSEVGITQALSYQPVPGGYKGSIPCDENTKSWGSIAFY
jgi:hypothetical protein